MGEGVRYRVQLRADVPVATAVGALNSVKKVDDLGAVNGVAQIVVHAEVDPRAEIAHLAQEHSWAVQEMERHAPSLEEAFLQLVGAER